MSGWNGFGSLNLSKVNTNDYAPLSRGEYDTRCTEAVVKSTGPGGVNKRAVFTLTDQAGSGNIKAGFNVFHSNAETQKIGLEQLKTFLTAFGHPNPDQPGPVEKVVGLAGRIFVDMGKQYTGSDGRQHQYPEVKRFIMRDGTVAGSHQTDRSVVDDDIPF